MPVDFLGTSRRAAPRFNHATCTGFWIPYFPASPFQHSSSLSTGLRYGFSRESSETGRGQSFILCSLRR